MDEPLKKVLAEIIAVLTEATKQVGSVAQEQLPLLVQEYIKIGILDHLMNGLVLAGITILLLVIAQRLRDFRYRALNGSNSYEDREAMVAGRAFGRFILPVIGTLCGIVGLYQFWAALAIYIAPRVYLVEKLRSLLP